VWTPHGAPGGYPGPDQYGETVNGGGYAYVLREDGPAAPSSPPHGREQGPGEWSPAARGPVPGQTASSGGPARTGSSAGAAPSAGSSQAGPVRAITTGAEPATATPVAPVTPEGTRPKPEFAADLDPALHYGPDDPAYGPPGPGWYKRDTERAPRAEDAGSPAATGEFRAARGPFEPLHPGDRGVAGKADQADQRPEDGDDAFEDPGRPESGTPADEPIDDEMPELLDFGTPTDPGAGALGLLRDLYQTAETVSPASLDKHFDELLERQRRLISDYFNESGGLDSAAAPAVPVAPADSSLPLGFDTAESLAGLRTELRGGQ
jgi:hypothetical protein